jgi:hypothetical protein
LCSFRRMRVIENANVMEVIVESCFHEGPRFRIQGLSRRALTVGSQVGHRRRNIEAFRCVSLPRLTAFTAFATSDRTSASARTLHGHCMAQDSFRNDRIAVHRHADEIRAAPGATSYWCRCAM